jgi:acetate kinase
MSRDLLIAFNAGSATVKIGLFELGGARPRRVGKGLIDLRARPLTFRLTGEPTSFSTPLKAESGEDLGALAAEVFDHLAARFDLARLAVAGHRIVHGGDRFAGGVLIDEAALAAIDALTPLAPLHQPQGLRLVRAIRAIRPGLPQTASFDTAFHRTQSELVRRFAIPRALHDAGVKRYGFHGLSYKYTAAELAAYAPATAAGKVVAAHLGSGASHCALEAGVSRDSSMGFSTIDGVPMATRCGALDPGVVLHLLGQEGMTREQVETLLYQRSGLLGVSGISADSRDLLASDRPEAGEALDLFAFRIAGEVARLAATLGGLDAIVFTAGIGENQPEIRSAVAERLSWLGLSLDPAANAANATTLSAASSAVSAFVIATDEEQVIADEAAALLDERN